MLVITTPVVTVYAGYITHIYNALVNNGCCDNNVIMVVLVVTPKKIDKEHVITILYSGKYLFYLLRITISFHDMDLFVDNEEFMVRCRELWEK